MYGLVIICFILVSENAPAPSLDDVIRATNEEVTVENRRLQALCTTLHESHHAMTLRVAQLQDAVNSRDTENAELKNQIDDLQYELMKVRLFCIIMMIVE